MFGTDATGMLWYRPSSLTELLSLKAQHCDARLVSGGTTIGLLTLYCCSSTIFCSSAHSSMQHVIFESVAFDCESDILITVLSHHIKGLKIGF